jgi:hypothetical protein
MAVSVGGCGTLKTVQSEPLYDRCEIIYFSTIDTDGTIEQVSVNNEVIDQPL